MLNLEMNKHVIVAADPNEVAGMLEVVEPDDRIVFYEKCTSIESADYIVKSGNIDCPLKLVESSCVFSYDSKNEGIMLLSFIGVTEGRWHCRNLQFCEIRKIIGHVIYIDDIFK